MIFFNVMNCILWSILCSLIRPNNGWLYHYNNKFMANRFGNVITAHHARNIAPVVYPRMNEDLDEVNMEKCTDGICVPQQICVNNTIVSNGEGLIQHRISDSVSDKDVIYCKDSEKCCKFQDEQDDALGSVVIDKDVETNEISQIGSRHCGKRNYIGFESRISGGGTAEFSEFPWMIVVLAKLENSSRFDYQCGGSLIHPKIVLTSAHCIDSIKPGKLKIRAGDWDIGSDDEIYSHQDRDVDSIVIHKGYSKPSLQNDIALLILAKPVELTENVNTICLPPLNYKFDNQRCVVSGWGKNSENGIYQTILKKVEAPIVPNAVCQRQLRSTILGKYFRLHRSFICAGGENGDSCKGDGGSPLMCSHPGNDGIYYQVGIVAWGIGCNQLNVPAAYVNVAGLRRWIDHEIKIRNLEMDYYIGKLT